MSTDFTRIGCGCAQSSSTQRYPALLVNAENVLEEKQLEVSYGKLRALPPLFWVIWVIWVSRSICGVLARKGAPLSGVSSFPRIYFGGKANTTTFAAGLPTQTRHKKIASPTHGARPDRGFVGSVGNSGRGLRIYARRLLGEVRKDNDQLLALSVPELEPT
ncbi:hypothetical protein K438DRAFT_1933232 [Mycena galopus ATCC 62051]|nr:hypothetical protein K438DRAFT_1933232 [Mycena galopus ATCC 62051]